MKKEDCELGMFVAVIQNRSSVSRNRLKIKRIGKIVGIYNGFVDLLLFDSNVSDFDDLDNLMIGRPLYRECFRFSEILKIEKDL